MTYQSKQFVSFDQCDPAGILFFANNFVLCHRALEEWINESQIGWNAWFNSSEFLVPLVHSDAEYLAPIFAGKYYNVEVSVEKLGTSSVKFKYSITDNDNNCTTASTTHVFIDKTSKKSIPIPSFISDKLQA